MTIQNERTLDTHEFPGNAQSIDRRSKKTGQFSNILPDIAISQPVVRIQRNQSLFAHIRVCLWLPFFGYRDQQCISRHSHTTYPPAMIWMVEEETSLISLCIHHQQGSLLDRPDQPSQVATGFHRIAIQWGIFF